MDSVSFLPIGGIGDVTKNMYLYEYGDEILIVDCGLGFADETMPGVDLLIPDVSYLTAAVKEGKKIVGMILSHGHEDHIGGLPFILLHLPRFPIYGSVLTSALANAKLEEFEGQNSVQILEFGTTVKLGNFSISLIRMTHSIIDASNIVIKTQVGTFYHGSDFKFDFTPVDGKPSELGKIARAGDEGILCLLSDALGATRPGHSQSEMNISERFEEEFGRTPGKVFVTTYSSNISRLNQAIEVAARQKRKVCFLGRSLLRSRDVGRTLNYMRYPRNIEIKPHEVGRYKPSEVLILVAGSQAQQDSALVRIASGDDKDLTINKGDTVIFSADPIPGNEVSINALIDTLAKRGAKVVYSEVTSEFHVSGHGSENDLKLLIALTHPKFLLPIGATYRQMVAYREIARSMGYRDDKIFLIENGQQLHFGKDGARIGKKIPLSNIFVDEITGEAVESFVVIDRMKIAREGVLVVIAEIDSNTGKLVSPPDLLTKGFILENREEFAKRIGGELEKALAHKQEKVTNWSYYKKIVERVAEQILYREGREPLIVPVVLEV